MNTEAIEHNINTLKNVGCDTKKSDSTKKCYLTKIEKKRYIEMSWKKLLNYLSGIIKKNDIIEHTSDETTKLSKKINKKNL